jgi:chlorophyll(ide) b reductase
MNFVIVGGSRGLGLSLTDQLSSRGHRVCVGARDVSQFIKTKNVVAVRADAADYADVHTLSNVAIEEFGSIDGWINCQGLSGGFGAFKTASPDVLSAVVMGNLLGTVNGSRRALEIFDAQARRGHVFNVTGAGFDFSATPGFAAYGATKAGLTQLTKTLRAENPSHGVHVINPGMMRTDLLYEGLPADVVERVNILAEHPDKVAAVLAIKMLMAMERGSKGMTINYMTMHRVLKKLGSSPAA